MEKMSGLFGSLSLLPKREQPQPKGNNPVGIDKTFCCGFFFFIMLSFLLIPFSRVVTPAEQQC